MPRKISKRIKTNAIDFYEWVFVAPRSDIDSLVASIHASKFQVDDGIEEIENGDGTFQSYVYIIWNSGKWMPAFRSALQPHWSWIANTLMDQLQQRLAYVE